MTAHAATHAHTPQWADLTVKERRSALSQLFLIAGTTRAAEILGTTRSSVIGFCNRQSIRLPGTQPKYRPSAPANDNVVLPPSPPHREPVHFLDLTNDQCRWGVGDPDARMFCGDVVHRKGYCAAHYARNYQPAKPLHPSNDWFSGQVGVPGITVRDALSNGGKRRARGSE